MAVAVSWMLAAGTNVAVTDEMLTLAVVGGGGPTMSPLPPQDPISQQRVTKPMKR
jgi:hypothetical protein